MARILLVDDEPVLAELLREVLVMGGNEVEVAHDVGSGLESFRAGTFDLVISDFLLPDRTGLDLAREIAAGEAPPPMILVTAYLEPELQEQVEAISIVVEVVRKPLDVFALRERVAHHVAERAQSAARVASAATGEAEAEAGAGAELEGGGELQRKRGGSEPTVEEPEPPERAREMGGG